MPERIQLRRTRGWRKPEGAVNVARPTRWGNPFKVGDPGAPDRAAAVARLGTLITLRACGFKLATLPSYPSLAEIRAKLAGHDLCCWCPPPAPGQPDHCHAAALLALANAK